jgi:hypothetical protein
VRDKAAAGDVAGDVARRQAAKLACDRCAAVSAEVAEVIWGLVGGSAQYWTDGNPWKS